MFRSALGIGTCRGSTVSRTSFFNLGSGDADVSLETSHCKRIFEVVRAARAALKLVCGEL
jgi:hypothetical protein